MEKNLLVYGEQSPVKHAASRFSVRKMSQKKERKKKRKERQVIPGWIDISDQGPVSFLSRNCVHCIMLTPHTSINLLNVVST